MIVDIVPGPVSGVFLIFDLKNLKTEDKRPYTLFEFKDKTGTVKGFVWNKTVVNLKPGDFVKITAEAQERKGEIVLKLSDTSLMKVGTPDNIDDYIYSLDSLTISNLWVELLGYINLIQDKQIKELLSTLIEEHESFGEFNLRTCPLSLDRYGNYGGALLEHIIYCCRHAKVIHRNYFDRNTPLDPDLLTAILILHDIGKLKAYRNLFNPEPTKSANLLGEKTLSFNIVSKIITKCGESPKTDKILASVLNDGRPKFIEEVISQSLHTMDILVGRYSKAINTSKDRTFLDNEEIF